MVGEFRQFLKSDASVAQDLDGGPCPERVVFFPGQVPAFPGGRLLGPDAGRLGGPGQPGAEQGLAAGGEQFAGRCGAGGVQPGRGVPALAVDGGGEGGHDGEPFAGPGVHAGLGPGFLLPVLDVAAADGAGDGPRPPAGGVVQCPLGEVEVEPADGHQDVVGRLAGDDLLAAAGGADGPGLDALLPPGGDVGRKVQGADAGVVGLEVLPEAAGSGQWPA